MKSPLVAKKLAPLPKLLFIFVHGLNIGIHWIDSSLLQIVDVYIIILVNGNTV